MRAANLFFDSPYVVIIEDCRNAVFLKNSSFNHIPTSLLTGLEWQKAIVTGDNKRWQSNEGVSSLDIYHYLLATTKVIG